MEGVREYTYGGASTHTVHTGTLPFNYAATRDEIAHGNQLLARWTAVTESAHPALTAMRGLLDRRKSFLFEKEVLATRTLQEAGLPRA
jgi:hypothetical protein